MHLTGPLDTPQLKTFAHWEEIKNTLLRFEGASSCVIFADDWSESIVFQLIQHDQQKTNQLVYSYHLFKELSSAQLSTALQRLLEGTL